MTESRTNERIDAAMAAVLAAALSPLRPEARRAAALKERCRASISAEPDRPDRLEGEIYPCIMAELAPMPLSAERREQLRQRIHESIEVDQQPRQPTLTVHQREGTWFDVHPGVSIKPLFGDTTSGARSLLMRLAPGARYPAHDHRHHEECMVLEGEVTIGEIRVSPGDYHLAPRGSRHATLYSEHGALLFLRAGYEDTELSAAGKLGTLARTVWNRLRGSA